jgi:hypothetical protein
VRRAALSLYVSVVFLALPAVAAAAGTASTSSGGDAPTGHDYTITTIFIVALGIPAVLAFLTLIDVARGKHTQRHTNH